MKFFGKLITKMLKKGSTPKQIAVAATKKGGTKETLKISLAKFVDPNKVKVGNKMMAFMPSKKQAVVETVKDGAGAGSKKLKAATKKATTPKKATTKKATTPKKATTKKATTKKTGSIPLGKGVKGGKIKIGKWLTTNKDVKSPAALYQKFVKEYPAATKQNIESALANIVDKNKKKNAIMIYKSLPNSRKGNPGTTSKNVKKAMSGGMVKVKRPMGGKVYDPMKKMKRPYGGKVYDPNKRIKRMGGGMIGHNGNDEVSRLYTTH